MWCLSCFKTQNFQQIKGEGSLDKFVKIKTSSAFEKQH